MATEFKLALVAICIILGSIWLRVPKKTATKWYIAVIFAVVGGLAGYWVEQEPVAALLGAASGAISPWLIRTVIDGVKKIVKSRADQLAGSPDEENKS